MSKRTGDFGLCCGVRTRVVDSRPMEDSILRRRACDVCGNRFSTREVFNDETRLRDSNPILWERINTMTAEQKDHLNNLLRVLAETQP